MKTARITATEQNTTPVGEEYFYNCYRACRLCPFPGAKCGIEDGAHAVEYERIDEEAVK